MRRLIGKDPELAEPSKPKMVIFGGSGVGKTWFALGFPKVYYWSPEPGATRRHYTARLKAGGGLYVGPEDGACDFELLIDQTKALATVAHPYRTLVVDSITEIYNLTIAKEAERLNTPNTFGAEKKPAIAYMRRFIAACQRLDMNVILIAHEKSEWGADLNGNRIEIGKTPDAWDKLLYSLDLGLHAVKRGKSRLALTRKSRLLGFPEGETFPLEYGDFAERYGKDVIEKEVSVITLATPEQVSEITRLVDLLKIEPEQIARWHEKANAETFTDYTTDIAAKTIKTLTDKLQPK